MRVVGVDVFGYELSYRHGSYVMSGGRVVQLFWRFWPWLLVVPVGLLFLAVGSRVKQYGLTESRYFVVLAGIWLTSRALRQMTG